MDYVKWIRSKVGHDTVILACACVVISDDEGRVMLTRRGDREADVWGFPGGVMELDESLAETAVRETLEETGWQIEVTGLLGVYSKYRDNYPNGDSAQPLTTFVQARIIGGSTLVDGTETRELAYFDPADPPTMLNQQHADVMQDVADGRRGVWR